MSEYAHSGRRSKLLPESAAIECRVMYGACYALFLLRAMVTRAMPWRRRKAGPRESIFREASDAASVMVTSSFMGL